MPNSGALTSFSATYSNDGYIRLQVNGNTGDPNNAPQRLYFSRWNQTTNQYDGEYYVSAQHYDGNDPGTIAPTGNRRYRWRVRGWRSDGPSGFGPYLYSDYVQTTPSAPSGAAAVLSGPNAISISWANNATNPFYDYRTSIFASIDGGGWVAQADVDPGVTSAYFGSLAPGSTYKFGIQAYDTYGAPVLYSTVTETNTLTAIQAPSAITGLTATRASDTQATLSWTNNASAGAPYSNIAVQRWDSVGQAWSTVANVGGTTTTITDTGIVAGRKYQWRTIPSNAIGEAAAAYSGSVFTTPTAPSGVAAQYVGGTSVKVDWTNTSSYSEYGLRMQVYKNGVVDGSVLTFATGTVTTTRTIVAGNNYYFRVWAVSDTGSLASAETQSNNIVPAAPPNAPTALSSSVAVIDVARDYTLSWTHSPTDGSAQTQYQIQHRVQGNATWTVGSIVASATSTSANKPFAATYANGAIVEWQVRTWGVHATAGTWSATRTQQTSTTPVITVIGPPNPIVNSEIEVEWTYAQAQGVASAEFVLDLYDTASQALVFTETWTDGNGGGTRIPPYSAVDGGQYRVDMRVRDARGVWSDTASRTFSGAFTPPAIPILAATFDEPSGAALLNVTPVADVPGVTLPTVAVSIERRFWDDEIEDFGDWELLISEAPVDATLVDPTGPTHDDGEYRVIAHTSAPSIGRSSSIVKPPPKDNRWLYVSGGADFNTVCKMWANIEISQTASRERALHYFAGRKNPVIYSGESAERTYSVSGILEDEATQPAMWVKLARQAGPVLLRAPGRRMYGNLSTVSIDRIQNGLHKISFSIQEVVTK